MYVFGSLLLFLVAERGPEPWDAEAGDEMPVLEWELERLGEGGKEVAEVGRR